eukprot:38308_1
MGISSSLSSYLSSSDGDDDMLIKIQKSPVIDDAKDKLAKDIRNKSKPMQLMIQTLDSKILIILNDLISTPIKINEYCKSCSTKKNSPLSSYIILCFMNKINNKQCNSQYIIPKELIIICSQYLAYEPKNSIRTTVDRNCTFRDQWSYETRRVHRTYSYNFEPHKTFAIFSQIDREGGYNSDARITIKSNSREMNLFLRDKFILGSSTNSIENTHFNSSTKIIVNGDIGNKSWIGLTPKLSSKDGNLFVKCNFFSCSSIETDINVNKRLCISNETDILLKSVCNAYKNDYNKTYLTMEHNNNNILVQCDTLKTKYVNRISTVKRGTNCYNFDNYYRQYLINKINPFGSIILLVHNLLSLASSNVSSGFVYIDAGKLLLGCVIEAWIYPIILRVTEDIKNIDGITRISNYNYQNIMIQCQNFRGTWNITTTKREISSVKSADARVDMDQNNYGNIVFCVKNSMHIYNNIREYDQRYNKYTNSKICGHNVFIECVELEICNSSICCVDNGVIYIKCYNLKLKSNSQIMTCEKNNIELNDISGTIVLNVENEFVMSDSTLIGGCVYVKCKNKRYMGNNTVKILNRFE